jgi:hypothetical protein
MTATLEAAKRRVNPEEDTYVIPDKETSDPPRPFARARKATLVRAWARRFFA